MIKKYRNMFIDYLIVIIEYEVALKNNFQVLKYLDL